MLVAVVALLLGAEYVLHNAEPILRRRLTESLSARFHAPVTLDGLSISLMHGAQVSGDGLRIGYPAGATAASAAVTVPPMPMPMIAVQHFAFHTSLLRLLRESLLRRSSSSTSTHGDFTHIASALLQGLTVHIPPERDLQPSNQPSRPEAFAILIDRLECRDVRLFLDAAQPVAETVSPPGKAPFELHIATLVLENVGRHQSMPYSAELTVPRPTGQIRVAGRFGPWGGDRLGDGTEIQPGLTPINGKYTFDHADLSTIKGISGTLTSTGHFAGTLNHLVADGRTDTPNFALSLANHPMPLHTDFHAIIDATTGDTSLQPVHAWLAGSAFTTAGRVVRVKGQGHDIQLDVDIPHGRIQDFLHLAVRTSPPLMNGTLAMRARLHIPPGNLPVPEKLSLAGAFTINGVRFNNPRWQSRLDGLSTRARLSPSGTPAQLSANLTLERGVLAVSDLQYSLPGVLALMNGVYSADGKLFEFKGHVRTEATASQMVGGWRGLLLSPFDRYLQRNGAGIDLPVEVSGTQGDLHFGLAFAGTEDKPAALLADIRAKAAAKQQIADAHGLAAQAAAEDAASARAATLEEAQRHHNNAVRLRSQAALEAAGARTPDH